MKSAVLFDDQSPKQNKGTERKMGTAMFPAYDSGILMIGSFGSVWIDATYKGKPTRIAFNTRGMRSHRESISS